MLPDEVDKLLGSYHRLQARAAHLHGQLDAQRRTLDIARARAIEGDAMHALNLDGMPHGNLPGNPVESLVLRYASGYEPRYIKSLSMDIQRTEDELFEAELGVRLVDGWMLCLSEREKYIVQRQVIDGTIWRDVLDGYEATFGQTSKDALKRIKARALEKIHDAAQ